MYDRGLVAMEESEAEPRGILRPKVVQTYLQSNPICKKLITSCNVVYLEGVFSQARLKGF